MDKRIHLLFILLLSGNFLFGQQKANPKPVTVSGTVYDISGHRPLEAVAVFSTSGKGTITDSLGHYTVTVRAGDSIWFSLLNKATMKFPTDTITSMANFDVMIHVKAAELPEVKVRNSNYRLDSIQNRKDYAKYFDFHKPTIRLSKNPDFNPGGVTVGLDLDEIINMFRTKRNRSLESLQRRLIQQEQDKYLDHRFSKQFIRKITKLQSPELDTFMVRYRPNYELTKRLNDLELGFYVEESYKQFKIDRLNEKGVFRKKDE